MGHEKKTLYMYKKKNGTVWTRFSKNATLRSRLRLTFHLTGCVPACPLRQLVASSCRPKAKWTFYVFADLAALDDDGPLGLSNGVIVA